MVADKINLTEAGDREIVITRVVDAPREIVWDAMTKPEHVVHWWGPRGFTTTIEEMDFRVGGTWKLVMHGPDGTDYPNQSIFREIVRPERIVYTHAGGRKGSAGSHFESKWTFEVTDDGKTRVTIRHLFPGTAERDHVVKEYGAIEGGKQTLARLGEFMAKTPVVVERTFHAPVETVWKALTEIDRMKQWYFDTLTDFKPEVGFATKVNVHHDGKDYPHLWKVTEAVPNEKIAYTWRYEGHHGESLVTFELFPEGNSTRLKLTHSGLETFEGDKFPMYARGNFVRGWTSLAASLAEHLGEPAPEFVITRTFDAPRELVWKAWTDPKRMSQWWGPRQFTNPVCELDVRVGGAWRIVMRSPEGIDYPCHGFYREIVDQEKLVMTMDCSGHPDEWFDQVDPNRDKIKTPSLAMIETANFEKEGNKTKLTVRIRFESAAIRDSMLKMGMTEGWSQSLDRLAELS